MDQTTPTLQALLADPTIFTTLPKEEQDKLYAAVAGLEAFCRAHLLVSRLSSSHEAPAPQDRAVGIKEAAGMLGMSKDFIYRRWRHMSGYKDRDGRIKFRLARLKYILTQRDAGR